MRVMWQEIIEQLTRSKGDKEGEGELTKGENTITEHRNGYRPLLKMIPRNDGKDDHGDDPEKYRQQQQQ